MKKGNHFYIKVLLFVCSVGMIYYSLSLSAISLHANINTTTVTHVQQVTRYKPIQLDRQASKEIIAQHFHKQRMNAKEKVNSSKQDGDIKHSSRRPARITKPHNVQTDKHQHKAYDNKTLQNNETYATDMNVNLQLAESNAFEAKKNNIVNTISSKGGNLKMGATKIGKYLADKYANVVYIEANSSETIKDKLTDNAYVSGGDFHMEQSKRDHDKHVYIKDKNGNFILDEGASHGTQTKKMFETVTTSKGLFVSTRESGINTRRLFLPFATSTTVNELAKNSPFSAMSTSLSEIVKNTSKAMSTSVSELVKNVPFSATSNFVSKLVKNQLASATIAILNEHMGNSSSATSTSVHELVSNSSSTTSTNVSEHCNNSTSSICSSRSELENSSLSMNRSVSDFGKNSSSSTGTSVSELGNNLPSANSTSVSEHVENSL